MCFSDNRKANPRLCGGHLIQGYVSLEKAREDYGVIINPQSMKVDGGATEKLRESLKKK
jgi:hypothetical protein